MRKLWDGLWDLWEEHPTFMSILTIIALCYCIHATRYDSPQDAYEHGAVVYER